MLESVKMVLQCIIEETTKTLLSFNNIPAINVTSYGISMLPHTVYRWVVFSLS